MEKLDWTKPICLMDGQDVKYLNEPYANAHRIDGELNETNKMLVSFYVDDTGCLGGVQVVKNKV